MSLTVFTKCDNCDKSVTVSVGKDDPLDRKYYCTDCCTSGGGDIILRTSDIATLPTIPIIKGFGDTTTVNVKTPEEKALDELKEFCVGV